MLIGDKIIFSHLQKTGGTYIASELTRSFPKLTNIKVKHATLNKKIIKNKKLVIGSIRDPYSYYISLWSYGCENRGGLKDRLCSNSSNIKPLIKLFFSNSNFRLSDFNLFKNKRWNYLYSDVNNFNNFREWLFLINDKKSFFDSCLPVSDEMDNGMFLGFYTRRFINQYFNYELSKSNKIVFNSLNSYVNTWIYMNDMKRTLNDAISKINQYEIHVNKKFKISDNKINESKHEKISYYYDIKTKNLVSKLDKFVLKQINDKVQ